jgi:hypothetical protein
MPVIDPVRRHARQHPEAVGPVAVLAASTAILAATFLAALWTLPRLMVLPVLCLAALASAASIALIAWRGGATERHPTYWDVAGALTFIGMCAAVLSEPDQVMALLEAAPSNNRPTAG